MNIQIFLNRSKINDTQITLVSESVEDRIEQFKKVLWEKKNIYKLKNSDNILKNIRVNDHLFEDS